MSSDRERTEGQTSASEKHCVKNHYQDLFKIEAIEAYNWLLEGPRAKPEVSKEASRFGDGGLFHGEQFCVAVKGE